MNVIVSDRPGGRDAQSKGSEDVLHDRWLVCAEATRYVHHGLVKCPRGGVLEAAECLACHLLETLESERDPRVACSTVE
jgi:hypothetical protein